jgi:hypothetical protein
MEKGERRKHGAWGACVLVDNGIPLAWAVSDHDVVVTADSEFAMHNPRSSKRQNNVTENAKLSDATHDVSAREGDDAIPPDPRWDSFDGMDCGGVFEDDISNITDF